MGGWDGWVGGQRVRYGWAEGWVDGWAEEWVDGCVVSEVWVDRWAER